MSSPEKPDKPTCPKCGNRLRVLREHFGTQIRCPKCNAAFVLGGSGAAAQPKGAAAPGAKPKPGAIRPGASPPEPQLPPPVEADDDAYEPIIPLVRHSIVPEEPVETLDPAAAQDVVYDADWSTLEAIEAEPPRVRPLVEDQKFEEAARERGLIRDEVVIDPPRWTFFSGVLAHPWRGVNLSRWTAMGASLGLAGVMAHLTLVLLGILGSAGNPVLGLLCVPPTFFVSIAALSFSTVSCLAVIQDTADGHDRPVEAPLEGWVLTLLSWAYLLGAAGALGYPLALAIGPPGFPAAMLLLFPILLLSALECGSYVLPLSPPVLRTLGRYWYFWVAFYVLSTLLLACWIAAFDFCYPHAPYLTIFFSGFVLATVMLWWARLLGRLAWRVSGMPTIAIDRSEAEAAAARPRKRKKRTRVRIEIPDEAAPGDGGGPPPRINFHLRP